MMTHVQRHAPDVSLTGEAAADVSSTCIGLWIETIGTPGP